jgi:streptomycin 6-kinase
VHLSPIPVSIRDFLLQSSGEAGERWLASVPGAVDRLVEAWSLVPVREPYESGTHAYTLPVERADGSAAVLKVGFRSFENQAQATALRAYRGDGAVHLLEFDAETGAMLLERAEPGGSLLDHDFGGISEVAAARRRIEIACGLYRRLWRSHEFAPDGFPAFPAATDLLVSWEREWTEPGTALLDRVGPEVLKRAAEYCRALAEVPELGIANSDTHVGNIISSRREPWLLIDPNPLVSERAFDAGYLVFQQDLEGPLGAVELLRMTAAGLGVDLERVRAWAFLRAVKEAEYSGEDGYDTTECLAIADEIERA